MTKHTPGDRDLIGGDFRPDYDCLDLNFEYMGERAQEAWTDLEGNAQRAMTGLGEIGPAEDCFEPGLEDSGITIDNGANDGVPHAAAKVTQIKRVKHNVKHNV